MFSFTSCDTCAYILGVQCWRPHQSYPTHLPEKAPHILHRWCWYQPNNRLLGSMICRCHIAPNIYNVSHAHDGVSLLRSENVTLEDSASKKNLIAPISIRSWLLLNAMVCSYSGIELLFPKYHLPHLYTSPLIGAFQRRRLPMPGGMFISSWNTVCCCPLSDILRGTMHYHDSLLSEVHESVLFVINFEARQLPTEGSLSFGEDFRQQFVFRRFMSVISWDNAMYGNQG